jgi:hypothetical protein
MSAVVLDAGALIALERNDRRMWARMLVAASSARVVLVPTTALAQVWRAQPAQARLARALAQCVLAPFDAVAREVGVLCGRAGTSDLCDAHVALVAATSGDVLCTSDPRDMERLLAACGARRPTILRC